ncbi:MAG: GNAT family N-acetyltransferase [Elusimicrobia bacterium]|nr:GNAT family N-acetyltransferase [Elusimicrobiota bacterium]
MRLRPARWEDGENLRRWRNDPVTRRNSLNTGKIGLREHGAWLEKTLADKTSRLYIMEDSRRRPLGQVRVTSAAGRVGNVHLVVDPEVRGRGVGREALKIAASLVRRDLKVRTLVAHIKPENVPSVVAFLKAGFVFQRLERVKGRLCYRLAIPI